MFNCLYVVCFKSLQVDFHRKEQKETNLRGTLCFEKLVSSNVKYMQFVFHGEEKIQNQQYIPFKLHRNQICKSFNGTELTFSL